MRKKITALATLAVIAVLIGASLGLVATQRRLLTENLDESIGTRVDEIESLVESGRVPPTLSGLGEDDTVAQVVVGTTVIATSANVAGKGPVAAAPAGRQQLRTVRGLPHDDAFRLLSRRVERPDAPPGVEPTVIHVAGTLGDIQESTRVLATSLSVAVPVVALLLAALIWWLVGRTLRPVEAIRAEVAGIGGSDLDRRVPVPPGDDEIARLARTMNTMLERVDDAAQRQARFVADASHELRSPLTRIRSELEVDLAHTDDADLAATHRSILEETVGLQHLVEDLLHLARTPGQPRRRPGPGSTSTTSSSASPGISEPAAGSRWISPASPPSRSSATPANSPGRWATWPTTPPATPPAPSRSHWPSATTPPYWPSATTAPGPARGPGTDLRPVHPP